MIPFAPIVASALAVVGAAQDLGPLATRNHRAASLAFLRFEPRSSVLGEGIEETSVSWTTANDFRHVTSGPLEVDEDYEVTRLALGWRRGVGHRAEVAVELPLLARGGGILDPIIDGWHQNVLHWSNPLRDAAPFGRSVVSYPGAGPFGSAAGLGDVTLGAAREIGAGTTARVAAKLPTGEPGRLLGSGTADLGVSVDAARALGRGWTLHAQAALVVQGRTGALDAARGWVDQQAVALVFAPNSRDRWIAQWQSERSALHTGVPASDAAHRLVSFGYRRALGSGRTLELLFSEDRDLFNGRFPEGANVGPDFTVALRLAWRR